MLNIIKHFASVNPLINRAHVLYIFDKPEVEITCCA